MDAQRGAAVVAACSLAASLLALGLAARSLSSSASAERDSRAAVAAVRSRVDEVQRDAARVVERVDELRRATAELTAAVSAVAGRGERASEGTRQQARPTPQQQPPNDAGDSRLAQLETWDSAAVSAWVADGLARGGAAADEAGRAAALFANVGGRELRRMAEDAEHGFSFADKLFFMGLDKRAIGVLEERFKALG